MAKDDALRTSLLPSSPEEAALPAFAGPANNLQRSKAARLSVHTVHRLVVVGASAPMLATARRMMKSVKTYLIHLDRGVKVSHRAPIGIEQESATIDISQVGTTEGISIVKSFADRVNADAIVSDDDWTLLCLAMNRTRFEPDCRVLAPGASLLERLWDKSYQVGLAQHSGFDVLPTYTLKTAEEVAGLPEEVFPAVVRPSYLNSASPNFKAKVLASRDEAMRLYNATLWSRPPILQRFCLGPNMVLHGIRAESGDLLQLRLFHVYRKYRGFSASMQPIPLPAEMEAAARRFVETAGLTGPFHFDLLVNNADEKVYFLEINTRLGGTTGKVIELGYDEPGLLLRAFHAVPARPLPPLPAHPRVTSVRLNLTQAWNDLFSRRDPLAYPQLPRAQSVLAALKEIQLVHHG